MKRAWIIDVCKTCGREATWPFCEHRPEPFAFTAADDDSWYTQVTVTGNWVGPTET